MEANRPEEGYLHFSVDSSLLFQLGEQLVAKPSVALAELVKNAYDADATHVLVTMEDIGEKGGIIVIEDNGHGMTFDEVRDNWMRIATNAKRNRSVSRIFCRSLTGAKGIGRFAARRLGERLLLQSIARSPNGSMEMVVAEFDWEKSFREGENLNEIPVKYTHSVVSSNSETGVKLFIEGARDKWTPAELGDLRRDLLTLQSPFPDLAMPLRLDSSTDCLTDPGFSFDLEIAESGELSRFSGELGEAFLNNARAVLTGTVDDYGIAHYQLEIRDTGENDAVVNDGAESLIFDKIKHARFRIYYFLYSAQFFRGSDFSVRDAARKGREEGGVRVYLDGFRVFPYGTEGDDWLQLDWYSTRNVDMALEVPVPGHARDLARQSPRARPWLSLPNNRQIFGVVSVSQSLHPSLEVTASREGFVENEALEQLRQFIQGGIYWLTIRYAAASAQRRSERKPKRPKTVAEIIEEAKTELEDLGQQIGTSDRPAAGTRSDAEHITDMLQSINELLVQATQQAQEEAEEHITEISMLRVLASAGTTILLMNHQLQALIGSVIQIDTNLRELRAEIPASILAQYDDVIKHITEWKELVEHQVSQLGFLLAPEKREQKKRHALYQVVENVRRPMSYYMDKYHVQFQNEVPRGLRTPPLYEAELYAILINILSNALKAVFERIDRRVTVRAQRDEDHLIIRMLDTGIGVEPEWRDKVFEPFISTSTPNPVLGVGTGMGLAVVRDVVEYYRGTVRFTDPEPPWQTCIQITLPY